MNLENFMELPAGKYHLDTFRDYPENKSYTDWRLPENRLEAFRRVAHTRMMEGELDHWMCGKIIADYMNLTNEQKAWYCLLFGFSYRNHWAMIVLQKFPEIWNTPKEEIENWYNDGIWKIVKFSKDTKWNVRKFPQFVETVKQWSNGSVYDKLHNICNSDTETNYHKLNTELQSNLYGIGRMTSWLTMQTVYEFFDLNIDHWDLQLTDSACWSQFEAMCYLFDRPDLVRIDKLTPQINSDMKMYTAQLMEYVNNKSEYRIDIFNIESCLCEFRKTAVGNKAGKIKEFTFWTANELIYEYPELKEMWAEHNIDWTPYLLGITIKGDHFRYGMDPIYFQVLTKTGLNLNTQHYFKDEPDAYYLLNIPHPVTTTRVPVYQNDLDNISRSLLREYKDRFKPSKHLRWK